jgi:hypothetical protein
MIHGVVEASVVLSQRRLRAAARPAYKQFDDDALAELYVYNALHGPRLASALRGCETTLQTPRL